MMLNEVLLMAMVFIFTSLFMVAIKVKMDLDNGKKIKVTFIQEIIEETIEDEPIQPPSMVEVMKDDLELGKFKEIGNLLNSESIEPINKESNIPTGLNTIYNPKLYSEEVLITGTQLFSELEETTKGEHVGVATCPHCGTEVPPSIYCLNCGKYILEKMKKPIYA